MRLPDLDLRLYVPKPPFWLAAFILVSLVGSWIPLALIARHRVMKHPEPAYHIFLDMDGQAKLKAQADSPVFADGRAMRPRVPGTIARGELAEDDAFFRGYTVEGEGEDATITYFIGYPDKVKLTEDLLAGGQQQFNIYCAPCHGASGNGMGTVQLRAVNLQARGNTGTVWTKVANLHDATFQEADYPNGKLFNTITHGKGAMNGYGAQIATPERWAIVAYVRALQMTRPPPPETPETPETPEADAPQQAEAGDNQPVALHD